MHLYYFLLIFFSFIRKKILATYNIKIYYYYFFICLICIPYIYCVLFLFFFKIYFTKLEEYMKMMNDFDLKLKPTKKTVDEILLPTWNKLIEVLDLSPDNDWENIGK
jgi:hypothetical protein